MPPKKPRGRVAPAAPKAPKAQDFVIKTKRLPKDPRAPKNPKTAYMFFASTCRNDLAKSHPGLSFTDTGREVGKRWQRLTDKQRSTWEKKAAADKDRYDREMKKYTPDPKYVAQQAKLKAKGPKLAKDPDKPKRGRTAYLVFCDLHRDQTRKKYPKKSMTEISAILAEKWSTCSAPERNKCDKTALKEKAAYEAALENYVPSAAYQEAMELVQNAKAASIAKTKQGNTKLKDKMKKHRMKVKALKSEIASIEKKMAKAQKLAEKLEIKQEHLEKAEIKLQEMAGLATGRIPVKPTIQKKTGKKKK